MIQRSTLFRSIIIGCIIPGCSGSQSSFNLAWENTIVAYPLLIEEPLNAHDSTSIHLCLNVSVQGHFPKQANLSLFIAGVMVDALVIPTSNEPYCTESGECWFQVYPRSRYPVHYGPTTFSQRILAVADSVVRLYELRVVEEGKPPRMVTKDPDFSIVPVADS